MNGRQGAMDKPLFAAVLLLLGLGVVLVYSSSFALALQRHGTDEFYLARQGVRAFVALACFMACINLDYHLWGRWSGIAYLAALVMLAALLFVPEGHAVNGARRWLEIGPLRFQVSDFARIALIVFLARKCQEAGEELKTMRVFIKNLVVTGVLCALIFFEPNFSTAAIVGCIALAMLFVAGAKFRYLTAIALLLIPLAALLILRAPYRRDRIIGFFDMSNRKADIGYQAYQSLVGLGNGGLFGVGIGKGEQKYFYLPEPHTDFIFSILGEEIGFIGLVLVLALLGFIVYRGMRIALNAPDRLGQTMAFGFTFCIAVYTIINASVASGLVPTTGLPMPFFSYGGMSLVFTMASMGVVLNISSRSPGPASTNKRER